MNYVDGPDLSTSPFPALSRPQQLSASLPMIILFSIF